MSRHATPLSLPESLGNWGGSHQLHALKTWSVLWHWAPVSIELPSWSSLADEARPVPARWDVQDQPRCGWQREVSLKVEQHFRDTADQDLLRSQGGPLAAAPFTSCPTDRIEPQCFRVLLLRRLRLPLPLSQLQLCRPLDVLGHHRAASATAGVLGWWGFAVESVVGSHLP